MYSSFQNISIWIYFRQRLFNGISFASKYFSIGNASLKIYIRRWSFNPISFSTKLFKFLKCLSLDLYSMTVIFSYLFCLKSFRVFQMCLSGLVFNSGLLILSPLVQIIQVFKLPLSGFIFGDGPFILYLLPQKYTSFQNASLSGFLFNGGY